MQIEKGARRAVPPPSQYVHIAFSSTSAAKAVEIGSALGTAEAVPFPRSTADSSVAQRTRSVGMTKIKKLLSRIRWSCRSSDSLQHCSLRGLRQLDRNEILFRIEIILAGFVDHAHLTMLRCVLIFQQPIDLA